VAGRSKPPDGSYAEANGLLGRWTKAVPARRIERWVVGDLRDWPEPMLSRPGMAGEGAAVGDDLARHGAPSSPTQTGDARRRKPVSE